jgi:hypothetical protein
MSASTFYPPYNTEKKSLCFLSSLVIFSLLTESKMQFHLRDLLRYDSVVSRKRKFGDK